MQHYKVIHPDGSVGLLTFSKHTNPARAIAAFERVGVAVEPVDLKEKARIKRGWKRKKKKGVAYGI